MNITAWILSIVGVAVLTFLTDIIMPEGETAKYIKGIFAIFTVFCIISPLPSFFNSDFSVVDLFEGSAAAQIDYGYIDYTNRLKLERLEKDIAAYLAKNGIENAAVTVAAEFDLSDMLVKAVSVDLSDAVALESGAEAKTIELVKSLTGLSKEKITVFGAS